MSMEGFFFLRASHPGPHPRENEGGSCVVRIGKDGQESFLSYKCRPLIKRFFLYMDSCYFFRAKKE